MKKNNPKKEKSKLEKVLLALIAHHNKKIKAK